MLLRARQVTALVIGSIVAALASFETAGAFNRWRYEWRAIDHAPNRPASAFYVSVNGSDADSGTSPQRAWRSISKVNQTSFVAGDSVLFEGGQSFPGNLVFGSDDLGTPKHPIRISSFGTGYSRILAGFGSGIYIHNTGGIEIEKLIVMGSDRDTNRGNGIIFQNDLLGGVKIPYVRVTSVEVHGFGAYGIGIDGNYWNSGFRDVRITGVSAHDNTLAGIYVLGGYSSRQSEHAHRDVYVGYSTVFNNSGRPGVNLENTGSGIVISDVDNGLVERNTAYNNGWLCDSKIGGPVGIWAWNSDSITIQSNLSFRNRSAGMKDGGGFDLDGAVTNSVLQYNTSYENDGAGLMICSFPGAKRPSGNVVRYNVSRNDGRKNSYSGIDLFGGVGQTEIYQNTVSVDPSARGRPAAVSVETGTRGVHFRNNLFYAGKGLSIIRVEPGHEGLFFQGNAYLSPGREMMVDWQAVKFSSVSEWRKATFQEISAGLASGVEGRGTTTLPQNGPFGMDWYLPQFRFHLIGTGLDLRTLGLDPGTRDHSGCKARVGARPDIGAHEWSTDSTGVCQNGRFEAVNP
jgi:hypothetical protein